MRPKPDRLAARRAQVAELVLRGLSYRQIAEELGLRSTKPISDDVEAFIAESRREQTHSIDEWTAVELARLGRLETEAWAGWARSQSDAETVSVETTKVVVKRSRGSKEIQVPALQTRETRTRKGQVGEPAFLEIALKCTARRCDILGLDKPRKIALSNGQVVFLMPDNGRGDSTPSPRS